MTATQQPPYRVADAQGEGWLRNGPDETYTTYPNTGLGDLTYEQLVAERGPLRPVEAMTTQDHAELVQVLAGAKKKGLATLLVALHRTALELIKTKGTIAALTAGRPGSWEASLMRQEIAWTGEGISASRVDDVALAKAEALLAKWTSGPAQVELSEGLLYVLVDAAEQAGGWAAITDRWLTGNEAIGRWTAGRR